MSGAVDPRLCRCLGCGTVLLIVDTRERERWIKDRQLCAGCASITASDRADIAAIQLRARVGVLEQRALTAEATIANLTELLARLAAAVERGD